MAATLSSAEQLQREMREVRAELRGNVQEMVNQAGGLTDWQQYVKAYPWVSLGAAAVAGFLLVPARSTVIRPDAGELLELAKSQQLTVQMEQAPARPGIVGSLMSLAGSALVQTAMSVLAQHLNQGLEAATQPPPQDFRSRTL